MTQTFKFDRSSMLMKAENTALLVIDLQEKLVPLVQNWQRMVWNVCRLIDGAKELGVRVLATEQYPQGLGNTVEPVRSRLTVPTSKTMFSCRECAELLGPLHEMGIDNFLLAGIETHVCVQQTGLDLLAGGFNVFVAADAIGSRHAIDHSTAVDRMRICGVIPTTTESALFEWCETAGHPQFKQISNLVRQAGP